MILAAPASRLSIRSELPADAPIIEAVVREAYRDISYSDHREHIMIARLRTSDAFDPALSLLAERDGRAVGQVLLTRASIRGPRCDTATLALAPLSVAPDFQRQGVGTALIAAAHEAARQAGFGSIVVVGIPGYYSRFGYEPLARYPIALPFEAPAANCFIIALREDALAGVGGMVAYANPWLDH